MVIKGSGEVGDWAIEWLHDLEMGISDGAGGLNCKVKFGLIWWFRNGDIG